jgi:hypothetical protein
VLGNYQNGGNNLIIIFHVILHVNDIRFDPATDRAMIAGYGSSRLDSTIARRGRKRGMMNNKQRASMERLQDELRKQRNITKPLPDRGESKERYAFTEVERTTVCFGPKGGPIVPAARSYQDAWEAAVYADVEFKKNMDGPHDYGHDDKIVDINWRCGSSRCECKHETYDQRFKRSVGRR